MNTIKKNIAIVIFIFCSCFSYGQRIGFRTPDEKLNFQKAIMSNASFIFECKFTGKKCYRQSPNGTILTCSTLEITKIFKGSGQITLGTINVISQQGGSIPEEHPNNEEYVMETNSEMMPGIGNGTYIIFGTVASSSMLGSSNSPARTIATDNASVLSLVDVIELYRLLNHFKSDPKKYKDPEKAAANFPVAEWGSVEQTFKTLDELYVFLKDNGGLTIQEEKK
jgi:hypothetical protein